MGLKNTYYSIIILVHTKVRLSEGKCTAVWLVRTYKLRTITYSGLHKTVLSCLWTEQLTLCVSFMHEQGFAHLDLKLDNAMIDDHDQVWIIDFSTVRKIEDPVQGESHFCLIYLRYRLG
jgi:serine/threonine protein kinase